MKYFITLIFTLSLIVGNSQPFTLQLNISNQQHNFISIGKVRGDRFILLDTIYAENSTSKNSTNSYIFNYNFESKSSVGMYRLMLGQTRYGEIMNEPPQHLDFIFNNESIKLKTSLNSPEEEMEVIDSKENKTWFSFKKKEKMYRQYLNQLRLQINGGNLPDSILKEKQGEYNIAMIDRELLINETVENQPDLFASRIIKMYHEPIVDAFLSEEEGRRAYIDEYFLNIDFTDEELINSNIYTDKVIHFIQSFGKMGISREKQEQEFIKAVDIVFSHANKNQAVFELILDYIVRGFEKLNLNKALIYIAENYGETTCQTDEKTTLQRRLGFQKMKPGTKVPEFILDDLNGDQLQLRDILKPKTLILFWASWCPHCSEMIPELKKLDTKVEIIAISIDSSQTEWQNKVYELETESWFNLSDLKGWDGEATENYNIYATPTMFLIDEKMKIIAKPFDLFELKELLRNTK